jgi:hypothetical protein
MTTLIRYSPDEFSDYEASFDRLDDHLDDAEIQARREEIDRLAERSGFVVTDDHAVSGGSFWLSLFALAAAVATICLLGVLVHVLGR